MRTKVRNSIICFCALATVLFALWGCSGSNNSDGGVSCGSYGCYNSAGQLVTGAGYPGYGAAGTAGIGVILQSQGNLMISSNPGAQVSWNNFIRGTQSGNTMFNSVTGYNAAPGLTINVNDPTFTGGYSLGNITILVQAQQLVYPNLYFRQTGNGFAAALQTAPYIQINPHNTNSGYMYMIYVTGAPTASGQQVTITSNGQPVASGTMARIQ